MADPNDDLLDPAELEALLNSAGAGSTGTKSPAPGGPMSQGELDLLLQQSGATAKTAATKPLTAGDIDALLEQRNQGADFGGPEALLEKAAADLAAAVGSEPPRRATPDRFSEARPFELSAFDAGAEENVPAEMKSLKEVELDLRIELGRTELLIDEVLKLREGSVVPLDKLAGDPVDILVNGRLIARGEVLVLNDNFCVRVAEILAPTQDA